MVERGEGEGGVGYNLNYSFKCDNVYNVCMHKDIHNIKDISCT